MKELVILDLGISSPAFKQNTYIPKRYTCDGENINPPLQISKLPKNTKSLAIIVDDTDAFQLFSHWVVWNITPINNIEEDSIPGVEGLNDFGHKTYGGPCPPSGTHNYHFKVYALDNVLELKQASTKADLEIAMKDHIIAQGELVGLYKRK